GLGGEFDIAGDGEPAAELEPLERPAQAEASPSGWARFGDVGAVEADGSPVAPDEAATDVEGCRLSGALGPDQAGDPGDRGVQVRTVDGHEPTEADLDVGGGEP